MVIVDGPGDVFATTSCGSNAATTVYVSDIKQTVMHAVLHHCTFDMRRQAKPSGGGLSNLYALVRFPGIENFLNVTMQDSNTE